MTENKCKTTFINNQRLKKKKHNCKLTINCFLYCRYLTEKKLNHQSWFLYYPEEGNKRGAPTGLLRGVEFGIETKALLFKRLCSFAGLHCEVHRQTDGQL